MDFMGAKSYQMVNSAKIYFAILNPIKIVTQIYSFIGIFRLHLGILFLIIFTVTTKSTNHPKPSKTTQNHPQPPTTTQNHPQPPTTSQKPPTTSQNILSYRVSDLYFKNISTRTASPSLHNSMSMTQILYLCSAIV